MAINREQIGTRSGRHGVGSSALTPSALRRLGYGHLVPWVVEIVGPGGTYKRVIIPAPEAWIAEVHAQRFIAGSGNVQMIVSPPWTA